MPRKKLLTIIVCLGAFMMACNFGGILTPKSETPTAAPATETNTDTPAPSGGNNMTSMLERLGGTTCEENSDFTCVTIQVPLNHFDSSNTETLGIVFAVAPATGERYGMYVQAFPGGPGGEGVSTGGLSWIPDGIKEHFDIVYFDQRGIGLSEPLTCPTAYAKDFLYFLNGTDKAGLEGYDTPAEQQAAIDEARTFVDECVTEIGIDPAKLSFYGTDQVAEDIESFRQEVGDEKFWLYGVSYGTAVAQTYTTSHADRLAGLVLDGTINMTLTGEEGALAQEKAFDKVLVAVLKACDEDEACAADLGGDALAVYDKLAAQISKKPIAYEFPLPTGEKVKKTFTFNQWEFTTAYQMYSLGGRMLFLGLGTGLGSAMVVDGILEPMELAHLPYKKKTYEQYVGVSALEKMGKKKWRQRVSEIVQQLKDALEVEYVVLGGGNAKKLKELPPGARLGSNTNAFLGGFRLWDSHHHKDASVAV